MSAFSMHAGKRHALGFNTNVMMAVVLMIIALVAVAWIYMGMVTRDRWPIRWLEVDGVFQRVSAERVRIKVSPLVTGSFFTVDLQGVRAQTAQLPWVSDVSVQKNWPDTVRIRVSEYTPVAHWSGGRLISPDGRVFSVPSAEEIQGLPWLEGPEGTVEKVFEAWQKFNNELYPTGLEIDTIQLDRRGSWFLALSNGTEVHIGREQTDERVRRMVASWPELIKLKESTPIDVDLRYSNGFAVRWPKPPPKLAANRG